tara:strand:+ start:3798 stop:3989 length:192 start_codon:yes stop_codon:yes gene_type:complete
MTRRTVRIKKGVKPYGSRRVWLIRRRTYPNGREVVDVMTKSDDHGAGVREYNAHEVEDEREEQ